MDDRLRQQLRGCQEAVYFKDPAVYYSVDTYRDEEAIMNAGPFPAVVIRIAEKAWVVPVKNVPLDTLASMCTLKVTNGQLLDMVITELPWLPQFLNECKGDDNIMPYRENSWVGCYHDHMYIDPRLHHELILESHQHTIRAFSEVLDMTIAENLLPTTQQATSPTTSEETFGTIDVRNVPDNYDFDLISLDDELFDPMLDVTAEGRMNMNTPPTPQVEPHTVVGLKQDLGQYIPKDKVRYMKTYLKTLYANPTSVPPRVRQGTRNWQVCKNGRLADLEFTSFEALSWVLDKISQRTGNPQHAYYAPELHKQLQNDKAALLARVGKRVAEV